MWATCGLKWQSPRVPDVMRFAIRVLSSISNINVIPRESSLVGTTSMWFKVIAIQRDPLWMRLVAFSSLARILEECSTIHSPAALFFSFFFLVEISSTTLIPLFRPESVNSGSASWDDCGPVFPGELRVSSFPDRFPHYAWTSLGHGCMRVYLRRTAKLKLSKQTCKCYSYDGNEEDEENWKRKK